MTLRYFGGMTVAEVAGVLGVSVVTVEQDWRLARAWLAGQLGGGTDDAGVAGDRSASCSRPRSGSTPPGGRRGSARLRRGR